MDFFFLSVLNSLAGKSVFFDIGIRFSAVVLPYALLGIAAFMLLRIRSIHKRMRFLSLILLSTIFARGIVTEIIRFFYNRPRPFEVMESVNQIISHTAGGSLPSGHMTFYVALAASFFFFQRITQKDSYRFREDKVSIGFFIAIVFIGLARIAAGVHWPSDILWGAVIGFVSAWGAAALVLRKQ